MDSEDIYITTLKGIDEMLSMRPLCLEDKKYYDFLGVTVLINLLTLPIAAILILYRILSPIITALFTKIFNAISYVEQYITTGLSNQEIQAYVQEMKNANKQLLQMMGNINNELMKQTISMIILCTISLLLINVSMKLAKKSRIRNIISIIASVSSSLSLIVFENHSIYFLIFVLMFLMIIIRYKPLGSMKYINFVRYILGALYLVEKSHKDVRKETKSQKKHRLVNILLTLFYLIVAFLCLLKTIPSLSMSMAFLIVMSLFLLIWANNARHSTILIFRKFILYICFIPIVVLYNNALSVSEPLKVLSVFITIFFSIERIINLSKEVKKEILKEIPKGIMSDLA